MAVFADTTATEEIPRDTYFRLEGLLQDLRLRIMRIAQQRRGKGAGDITRGDVDAALARVAETGLDCAAEGTLEAFPNDAYLYLEKRLHDWRRYVIGWAAKFAREDGCRAGTEQRYQVRPEHIQAAWGVSNDPVVLRSVLVDEAAE